MKLKIGDSPVTSDSHCEFHVFYLNSHPISMLSTEKRVNKKTGHVSLARLLNS